MVPVAGLLKELKMQFNNVEVKRLVVKWTDGKTTRPCTKGMFTRGDGDWQIG